MSDSDSNKPSYVKDKNPMDDILLQLQDEAGEASVIPEEEMTHVSGVSFVDSAGLSLGAAPEEEAGHAGAYRYIANCANALEALVLQGDDEEDTYDGDDDDDGGDERGGGLRQDGRGGHEEYGRYPQQQDPHPLAVGGAHQHHHQHHHHSGANNSSNNFARSSTRLKGKDRHVVIQRKGRDEVAVVVLTKRPEYDSSDEQDGPDSTT
ncbi:unnamed protein product [Scytosiphon promiscuus]